MIGQVVEDLFEIGTGSLTLALAAPRSVLASVRALEGDFRFETFFSLSCQNCPDVVQALNIMAALNPNVHHVAIDGALFQDEVERRKVMAVPSVFLNGEPFAQGRMELEQIVAKTGFVSEATSYIVSRRTGAPSGSSSPASMSTARWCSWPSASRPPRRPPRW